MKVLNTRKDPLALARAVEAAFDAAVEKWEQEDREAMSPSSEDPGSRIASRTGDMTMSITKTTLDAVLKELYAGQAVQDLAYDASARPLLTMLKKRTDFGGVNMPLPVIYDDVQGRSYTFSKAQANISGGSMIQFALDVTQNYSLAQITTDALLRSRNDKGAFLNGLKFAVDSAINRLSNDIESALFRDGTGAIGVIASLSGGNKTVTLENTEDVVNFAVGQKVVAADTKASALRSSTAGTVSGVDRDAGTVTFSLTLPATFDGYVGDYLFTEGDYDSASDKNKIYGLDAWIPSTAPTSGDSFFGVDRSADPTRLAGVRYTGSSAAIEESIVGAAARLGRECGAIPDTALMSFTTFRRLVNEVGSKVQRDAGGKATMGFQSLQVYGPRGVVNCVPCTFCQEDVIWLLTSKSWVLVSMGDAVQVLEQDGNRILRVSSSDALEVRVASYSQLGCSAPGWNCRIAL
jgi:hypothetical protein